MIKKELAWKWVLMASLLFALFIIIILPQVANYSHQMIGQSESPDTSLFYSADDLYQLAETYGQSGRAAYIKLRWTFDLIWPLVYTLFLVLWIIKLSSFLGPDKFSRFLFILPIIAMVFDFLENLGATIIMFRYPLESGIIANLTPIMTFLKWLTLLGSFLMIIILLVLMAFIKFRKIQKE